MRTDKLTKSDTAWQAMRMRANKRLGGNATLAIDEIEAMTAQDVLRLFHELQVHQVELEMQNDELHRVQNALQSERERYLDLYEQAPVGYCSVSETGLILQINRTAAALLGHPQSELVQQPITRFICHGDQDGYYLLHKQLVATGAPQSSELCMLRKDGAQFWVLLQATVTQTPLDMRAFRIVMSDITARKQVELDYRIAASVFESTEGMMITDAKQVVLRVNKAFTEITGYTTDDVVGKNPHMLCSGEQEVGLYAQMWRSIELCGAWQGEVWNRRKNGEVYPARLTVTAVQNTHRLVSHYVATLSDVTARKAADEQIMNLAFYDPLTHLPNRRLLMHRLAVALPASVGHQGKGALLFIDLDGFKTINDTLGHLQGDLVLEQVAARLTSCVRDGDTVARLGGDEFVVMLEQLSQDVCAAASEAQATAEKILVTLDHLYPLSPAPCRITCSIGVTLFGVDPHETLGEPMKRADLAMYQAKAGGRNTLRFFDPQMQAIVTSRLALENGLREAIHQRELRLHYQPQVEGAGRLVGVEALVRWQRPLHGLVLPAEFIAISEETGLILPLGHWVLETACAQLASWAQRVEMAHLTMSVNVSASQMHQYDFVQEVLGVLERTGANPHRLKLELTESVMVSQIEDVIGKMRELEKHGVRFSLDDFGTGYSSLAYLKRMPLEQLKIDQGFVRDILTNPNDAAISKMVIALAESIGLKVIAEGVETTDQRDFLASQGCHAYQGFLSSRPLPLDEFEAFAEDRRIAPGVAPGGEH